MSLSILSLTGQAAEAAATLRLLLETIAQKEEERDRYARLIVDIVLAHSIIGRPFFSRRGN